MLGEAWFYALKLKVNNQVLIPRPETEELVNLVLAKKYASPPSILDIGTGSGCIPIAIKKNLPDCTISGIDISDGALRIALENSILHGTNISFIQADITDESGWHQFPQYDCVISNPPYIPLSEKALMDTNVTAYEPATALFVTDKDPFLFYRKIALFGKQHLNPGGMIFFETHENYAGEVATILSQDYKEVCIFKDVFGKERMVTAILYH